GNGSRNARASCGTQPPRKSPACRTCRPPSFVFPTRCTPFGSLSGSLKVDQKLLSHGATKYIDNLFRDCIILMDSPALPRADPSGNDAPAIPKRDCRGIFIASN